MTDMIQVCSYVHRARAFIMHTRQDEVLDAALPCGKPGRAATAGAHGKGFDPRRGWGLLEDGHLVRSILFHTILQLDDFRTSTPSQNRQLSVSMPSESQLPHKTVN